MPEILPQAQPPLLVPLRVLRIGPSALSAGVGCNQFEQTPLAAIKPLTLFIQDSTEDSGISSISSTGNLIDQLHGDFRTCRLVGVAESSCNSP